MKKILLSILIMAFALQSNCFAFGNKNKEVKTMTQGKIVQTAGRDNFGNFAPEFAHFNDDILFGENWNNTDLPLKTRCIITVVALMSQGITDSSMKHHLQNAKNA